MIDPPGGGYLGLPLLVAEDGAVKTDYDFARVHFVAEGEEKSVAIIPISVVQRRVLAAVPAQVWSKVTAERLLPPRALVKPYLIEVVAARADKPEEPLDETVQLWIGFLDRRLAETAPALSAEEEVDFDLRFSDTTTGEERIPFGQALADIAEDHYVFQSAAEGGVPLGDGGGPGDVERRMAMLEEGMVAIQASLNAMVGQRGMAVGDPLRGGVQQTTPVAVPLPSPKSKSALKRPKDVARGAEPLAHMDPAVVHSARQAGIPEDQLNALARLLGKTNRMGDHPAVSKAAPRGMELSESDEEEEEAEAADGGALDGGQSQGGPAQGTPIEKALVQLTKIVGRMSRKPGRDLEALLDGADGGSLEFPQGRARPLHTSG